MDTSVLLRMYRKMLEIRRFELRAGELFERTEIPGATHLYLGQEAVAVGACSALKDTDYIISTHRGHGHCIAKGGKLPLMMAELFGRSTGYCKGRGGSMHIADLDIGILGANGVVGGGLPVSVGVGLAAKLRKTRQVTLCFFGDGACNQGTFHESLNMAAVMKLPVVFVCENNQFAVSTHVSLACSVQDIAQRGASYNIPGHVVDGNDVVAVFEKVSEMAARAREGAGPSLIECKTYRWSGHYVGDSATYRDKEEVNNWKSGNDPIARFRGKLIASGLLDEAGADEMQREAVEAVAEAEDFARNSPPLLVDEVAEDVYTEVNAGAVE